MRRASRTSRRGGFTLIEVLATLLLVGIVMPVVMRCISTATGAAAIARDRAQAAALGETRLNELIISGEYASGGAGGDFSPDFPGYRWTAQSVERDVGVIEVRMTVTWPWRNEERSVVLSTLVYQSIAIQ